MDTEKSFFDDIDKLKESIERVDSYADMSLISKLPDGREIEFTFAPSLKKLIELSKEQQQSAWYSLAKLTLFNHHYKNSHKETDSEDDFLHCNECGNKNFKERKEEYLTYMYKIIDSLKEYKENKD